MFGLFKSKTEKLFNEIMSFENRLMQRITPYFDDPTHPTLATQAMMAMATNIGIYFITVRKPDFSQKQIKILISNVASNYGAIVENITNGVSTEDAVATSLIQEMNQTKDFYFGALDQSAVHPEAAIQGCLDTLMKSAGGWEFKNEDERATANVMLSEEITSLMKRFRTII